MQAIIFSSSECQKEDEYSERRRTYATGVCVGDNTCGRVSAYSLIASLKSFLILSCRGNTDGDDVDTCTCCVFLHQFNLLISLYGALIAPWVIEKVIFIL